MWTCVSEKEKGKKRKKGGKGGSKKDEVLLYFLKNILRKSKCMQPFKHKHICLFCGKGKLTLKNMLNVTGTNSDIVLLLFRPCQDMQCSSLCFVTVLEAVYHVLIWRNSSGINENSVIVHSPSCCSRIWLLFCVEYNGDILKNGAPGPVWEALF